MHTVAKQSERRVNTTTDFIFVVFGLRFAGVGRKEMCISLAAVWESWFSNAFLCVRARETRGWVSEVQPSSDRTGTSGTAMGLIDKVFTKLVNSLSYSRQGGLSLTGQGGSETDHSARSFASSPVSIPALNANCSISLGLRHVLSADEPLMWAAGLAVGVGLLLCVLLVSGSQPSALGLSWSLLALQAAFVAAAFAVHRWTLYGETGCTCVSCVLHAAPAFVRNACCNCCACVRCYVSCQQGC